MTEITSKSTEMDSTGNHVTVVIPTRERPELLRRAVMSVVAQTRPPREVIVVEDGGITSATGSVIEDTRATATIPIRLLASVGGAPRTRNLGLAHVTTTLTAFLDDDDYWQPTFLEHALVALRFRSLPTAVFTAATILLIEDQRTWTPRVGDPVEMLTRNCGFAGQNGVFPTASLRAIGGWDENLVAFQDRDLQLRLALAGTAFTVLPEPLTVIDKSHQYSRISTRHRADGSLQFTRKWWAWAPPRTHPRMVWQFVVNQRTSTSPWRRTLWRTAVVAGLLRRPFERFAPIGSRAE